MKNAFQIRGDVVAIILRRRDGTTMEALVDLADFALVQSVPSTWFAWKPKDATTWYAVTAWRENKVKIHVYMHRLVSGEIPPRMTVDHRDHDGLNNRRYNIRVVTNRVNCLNRRGAYKNSKSGIRGVCWSEKHKKWRATAGGQHLGYFADSESAAVVVKEELKRLGE